MILTAQSEHSLSLRDTYDSLELSLSYMRWSVVVCRWSVVGRTAQLVLARDALLVLNGA